MRARQCVDFVGNCGAALTIATVQVARRVIDTTLQSLQQGVEDAHEALLCTLRLCRLACRVGADAQHAQHVLAWLAQGMGTGAWPRMAPYVHDNAVDINRGSLFLVVLYVVVVVVLQVVVVTPSLMGTV